MNLEQIDKVQKTYEHYDVALLTATIADIAYDLLNVSDVDDQRLEIFKLYTLVKLLDLKHRQENL